MFETSKIALRDEKGRPYAVVGIAADVTEREHMHEEIRRTNACLEAKVAERTEALSKTIAELERFTYMVAHDLRAPLRGIHRYSELLLEDHELPEGDAKRYLHRVVNAAKRMDGLIGDLLTYSRVGLNQTKPERQDLNQVVQETVDAIAGQIEECGAKVNISGTFPAVLCDRLLLNQILMNRLSNALKFVPPGRKPSIKIWATRCGRFTRLWVQDNGIGIEARYRDRVFALFERLHREHEYPGTGMGLAIVNRAVEQMGGKVGVESELGRGSRFWVELRLAEVSS